MSERWDAGTNGADDWDGWGSGRTTSASSRPSLRRHSQPRDTGVDGTSAGRGDGRGPGTSSGAGGGSDFAGGPDFGGGPDVGGGPGFGRGPDVGRGPEAALPADGDTPGQARVPGGRRPDASSFDPVLTPLPGSIAADDPRDARSSLFPGPPLDLDLQPGTRLRVGPRHGVRQRSDSERAPRSPARAAVGAVTEVAVVLGMALLLSLLIKTFLVQAFFIPSPSMENTLLVGDRVLVSKLTPGIFDLHRGDVVVFKDPGGWLGAEQMAPADSDEGIGGTVRRTMSFVGLLPQDAGEHLIKRVIGIGGDHVVCCDTKGRITVNGAAIDETPYLVPGAAPSDKPFDVNVPRGYLWVMGDNRPVSADSRLHRKLNNGMVPVHDVVGKAFVIVWPFDRAGGLGVPASVFARVPDPPSQ